jgi:hypothetical protein
MRSKGLCPRHRSGEGNQNVSAVLKVSKTTVASIILQWKKCGTTKTLPRAGHLAKLTNRRRRALVREVTKNLMVTLTEPQCFSVEMGEPSRQPSLQESTSWAFMEGPTYFFTVSLFLSKLSCGINKNTNSQLKIQVRTQPLYSFMCFQVL